MERRGEEGMEELPLQLLSRGLAGPRTGKVNRGRERNRCEKREQARGERCEVGTIGNR